MLSQASKDCMAHGRALFDKRSSLMSLWQELGENFYPERADFTYRRSLGDEFAEHLTDSYPILVRRDLGNAFDAMLRPAGKPWMEMTVDEEDRLSHSGKQWLEWATKRQRKAMYNRRSQFTRATKEGDHDWSTFGQAVFQLTRTLGRDSLLYRTHHLRDNAWAENADGVVDVNYRKWKAPAVELRQMFGDKIHEKVRQIIAKEPYREIDCWHAVVPADRFDLPNNRHPFVELYLDVENEHELYVGPSRRFQYVIPRWQTVSGSQYAYSPASIVALPDARLIQAITYTLLQAGEKYVDPPMVATEEVVRSDVGLYAGGITWVDRDYDERLGEALRPIKLDRSGMPIGFDMSDRQKAQIAEAFYINKLSLPPSDKDMTAFEVSKRVQEYIRGAMPLFGPMEDEVNGALCEETFTEMFWAGGFGSLDQIPRELLGDDVRFKFKSPIKESEDAEKVSRFLEASQILGPAAEVDPTVFHNVDIHTAVRDALDGAGVPQTWLRSEEDAAEAIAAIQQKQEAGEALAAAQGAAQVAETAGKAGKEMRAAGLDA